MSPQITQMYTDGCPRNTRKYAERNTGPFVRISNLLPAVVFCVFCVFRGPLSVVAEEAPEVVVRASVSPEGAVYVGQRVRLLVDVLGRDGWANIAGVRDFEVPGAYVVDTGGQGVRLQETINGASYSGQQQELSLFPRRGGRIEVPAVPVDVVVRTFGAQGTSVTHRAETSPLSIDVTVPPGAEGVDELVSSPRLTARQRWSPPEGSFRVGDALKRTVTFEAEDVSGMAFTPLVYAPLNGVGIYPEQPEVVDRTDRGTLSGSRTEVVAYVFEASGRVEIPSIERTWFDLVSGTVKTETLPGQVLEIAAAPQVASSVPGSGGTRTGLLVLLVVAAVGLVLLWRFRSALIRAWARWRDERRLSEPAYFARFRNAAQSNDPVAAFNALMQWLDRCNTGTGLPLLGTFVNVYGNDLARGEVERLWEALASREPWTGDQLYRSIRACRRTAMAANLEAPVAAALPSLNPAEDRNRPLP